MAKKRKTQRKKRLAKSSRTWIWLALLGLTGGLLVGLIWVSGRQPVPPVSGPPSPSVPVAPVSAKDLEAAIESFLATVPVRSSLVRRDLRAVPARYTVDGKPPSPAMVKPLRERLKSLSPELSVRLAEDDLLIVAEDGVQRILVFFVPALQPMPTGPRVAIIVDDLGRDLVTAETLIGLDQPVTFSILPGEVHAREVALMAHAAKREVLLHAPMEPQGYPDVNPGSDALFLHNTDEELTDNFSRLLEKVPEAVGSNNHMGSRFTEDRRGMNAIMTVLRDRGLFFVDSLTTPRSVGKQTAEELGVAVLQRDVFLDNDPDVEKIAKQLQRLADRAVRNGQAIGICHPYPETLLALQRELPRLAEQGVRFVTVSRLLGKATGGR
ncbi:MAG TPA: divergent polysaccharide deacetylase family protein [Desulfuromonadales bacterium]|nr:divergent polysaccharide deacetylase family protein [Desulfuromonadales bacterium]